MKYALCIAVGVVIGYQVAQRYDFEFKLEEKGEDL